LRLSAETDAIVSESLLKMARDGHPNARAIVAMVLGGFDW